MVPSLKFTLIIWLVIIGFGSLSFALKNKKGAARIHSFHAAKSFSCIEPPNIGWLF